MRTIVALLTSLLSISDAAAQQISVLPPLENIPDPISVSPIQLRPAAGAQNQPRIASGNHQLLAVWSDSRYGGYDVFATRLDTDGKPLDPAGIPIIPSWADDLDPDVTWNGSEYVVVWRSLGVYGARVGIDGHVTALGKLADAQQAQLGSAHTAIEWNGSVYLLEWTDGADLFGQILDATATPAGNKFLIAESSTTVRPEIATDGRSFVTVWEDSDSVRSVRIDAAGAVSQIHVLGSPPPHDPSAPTYTAGGFPDVQFGHGEYVVVWSDSKIRAIRLATTGEPIANTAVLSPADRFAVTPAAAPVSDGWLVTWASSPNVSVKGNFEDLSRFDIASLRIASDLRPISVPTSYDAQGFQVDPVVASIGDDVIAVWTDGRNSLPPAQSFDLRFIGDLFSMNLTRPSAKPQLLTFGVPNQSSPAVAASRGIILAVWTEQISDTTRTLFGRRFDSAGAPLDPAPFSLPEDQTLDTVIGGASITASNTSFAVAWEELSGQSSEIRAVRIGTDGVVLDSPSISIAQGGSGPAVASDGIDFLIAWSQPSERFFNLTMPIGEVRATVLTHDGLIVNRGGTVLSDEVEESQASPVATWNGNRYFVAWAIVDFPARGAGTRARFVSAAGFPLDASSIVIASERYLGTGPASVASSGRDQVVINRTQGVYVVSTTGQRLDGSPEDPGTRTMWPLLIFDGSDYVNGPAPMAATAPGVLAIASSDFVKMLPASHTGGVTRLALRLFRFAHFHAGRRRTF